MAGKTSTIKIIEEGTNVIKQSQNIRVEITLKYPKSTLTNLIQYSLLVDYAQFLNDTEADSVKRVLVALSFDVVYPESLAASGS